MGSNSDELMTIQINATVHHGTYLPNPKRRADANLARVNKEAIPTTNESSACSTDRSMIAHSGS